MTYEEEQRVTLARAMANEPPLSWLMNLQENLIQIIQKIYGASAEPRGIHGLMVSDNIYSVNSPTKLLIWIMGVFKLFISIY